MNILESIAEEMCLAARTAPKARGIDSLELKVIKGNKIRTLSKKMIKIGEREDHKTFLRDGRNILNAGAVVLLGAKRHYLGLRYCGFCGFADCAECEKNRAICAYVPGDLGIALGSAVSVAMDHRVDNRIMFSAGKAAIELGMFRPGVKIAYGVPLSVSGKNPFFDRK